jgi:hypothetical protein
MTSKKDESFKQIIEQYIEHKDTSENKELEVRFGTLKSNKKKRITKTDYDLVIKTLKSMGFICDNVMGEYMMRIGYMYINKSGRKERSNIRVELNGHHVVKTYCEKESLTNIFDDANLKNYVEFVKKEYMINKKEFGENGRPLKIFPYNSDDFGFRVALQTEKKMETSIPFIKNVVDMWDETEKTFRYIKRFRFKHPEYPVFCDMSIVKSSRFGKTHYILEDSNVFKNLETYEIELEVDNTRTDEYVEKYGADGLLAALKKSIKIVLQGLQDTKFPVSNNELDTVSIEYSDLVFNNKNMIITPKQFIGPSSYTLQMKNVMVEKESENIHNIRSDYTVTDKADGERNMCYISEKGKIYLIDSNMRIKFTGSITKERRLKKTLIDGELIMYNKKKSQINLFAAFDVYFVDGKDVRKLPFVSMKMITVKDGKKKKENQRHSILKDVIDLLKPVCVTNDSVNQMRFSMKLFEISTKERSIFECCKSLMERINHESYSYETDGLIFTPAHDKLPSLDYKHTWDRSFKWKPPKFNTIDFLIKYSKSEKGDDVIKTLYEDGVGGTIESKKYKEIRLLCGFNQGHKDHGYMNPCELVFQNKIPDRTEQGTYEPMPFYPTQPYDASASICNIMIKKDSNGIDQLFTTEGDIIENNTIVEFAYDNLRENLWKWIPLRVRHDKTYQYKSGMKNYGNAYHVANSNWQSIHNPVTELMITTGRDIPDEHVDDDVYYNRVSGKTQTRALRDFHNMFVKKLLIKSVTKPGGTLMDFAVGKGGDFPKWISSKLSFVYGIDISRDNIEHKIDGACSRYLNNKRDNSNTPDALFIEGDSGKHIKSGEAFETDIYKKVNKAVFGEGPKDKKILGEGIYKQYGIGKSGFDVTSCQFAFHYFFKDKDIFKTFLENVSDCTAVGGYFIGTCYDGETIYNMLKDKQKGESIAIFKNNHKIWEIKKDFEQEEFPSDSSSLGYEISVYQESINQMIPEFLVNFSYVVRIMSNYGFKIVGNDDARKLGLPSGVGMFKELYNQMSIDINSNKLQERNIGSSLKMSEYEKRVSFLNKYFVFKKTEQVRKEDIHKEFEDIQDEIIKRKTISIKKLNKTIKLTQA